MEQTEYLMVYGTLMRGLRSSKTRFLNAYARFTGEVTVPGRLYDLGDYPGLVYDPTAATIVTGHLFALDDPESVFAVLDPYEGIDPARPEHGPYVRRTIEVAQQDARITSWVYLFSWPTDDYPVIASGHYLTYVSSNPRHQKFIRSA